MRFRTILLAYFLIGATMWAGGAIQWDDAGVGQLFIDVEGGDANPNRNATGALKQAGGPIQEAAQGVAGAAIALWNLLIKFIGFLFWPIVTLESVEAPLRVVVILGGAPTVVFYGALFSVLQRSV